MFRLIQSYREGFRVWVRRRMRPISIEEAEEKRLFWAKAYAMTSIFTFGVISYISFSHNVEFPFREDLPKNVAAGVQFNGDSGVRFITFSGFEKVSDFTYSKEKMHELAQSDPKSKTESKSESELNDSTTKS